MFSLFSFFITLDNSKSMSVLIWEATADRKTIIKYYVLGEKENLPKANTKNLNSLKVNYEQFKVLDESSE